MLDDELRKAEFENNSLHVSNAVLDNCLSALKHETMYYPSRIRQLLDVGEIDSLDEVTAFYRELYGVLSQQAMREVEHAKLHVKPIRKGDVTILGDENMIRYLLEILRKQSRPSGGLSVNGPRAAREVFTQKNAQYVELHVPMPSLILSDAEAANLFMPSKEHIPFLLCRQIVRDLGEATNRRGCGIRAEVIDGLTTVIVTLPSGKM